MPYAVMTMYVRVSTFKYVLRSAGNIPIPVCATPPKDEQVILEKRRAVFLNLCETAAR
jgi:hypothetical protein